MFDLPHSRTHPRLCVSVSSPSFRHSISFNYLNDGGEAFKMMRRPHTNKWKRHYETLFLLQMAVLTKWKEKHCEKLKTGTCVGLMFDKSKEKKPSHGDEKYIYQVETRQSFQTPNRSLGTRLKLIGHERSVWRQILWISFKAQTVFRSSGALENEISRFVFLLSIHQCVVLHVCVGLLESLYPSRCTREIMSKEIYYCYCLNHLLYGWNM